MITSLQADELFIPFSCYPQLLVKEFKKYKMRLDLDPAKRNDKSWGYLKNEGSSYKIYTYKVATEKELMIVLEIVRRIEREQKQRSK